MDVQLGYDPLMGPALSPSLEVHSFRANDPIVGTGPADNRIIGSETQNSGGD